MIHKFFGNFGRNLVPVLFFAATLSFSLLPGAHAQERLPWHDNPQSSGRYAHENPVPQDEYRGAPRRGGEYRDRPPYGNSTEYGRDRSYNYQPPREERRYQPTPRYDSAPPPYRDQGADGAYGPAPSHRNGYTDSEIMDTGHRFFGTVSSGLAKVVEYAFSQNGKPNGYILGEEAGGAFVAGLRYGEGTLYTKHAGQHRVYWQGPSIGYDFGAEGSKTMILVYNIYGPDDIYGRFGGVDGSAYLVGGVGLTFQKRGHVTLAPIRAGVGARLGANVGYLKYTRYPTWNPF